jgi:hypothetical protein
MNSLSGAGKRQAPGSREVGSMKHCLLSLLVMGLLVGATGCVTGDSDITCERLDRFMTPCHPECTASWNCAYYYRNLHAEEQELLDDCADCLMREGDSGSCDAASCQIDDGSGGVFFCTDLLTQYLVVDCTW